MFTVTYSNDGGTTNIVATNVRNISITPNHDRKQPQSISIDTGIGGGGQNSRGTIIPIANVVSIEVDEV
jgi:hypothetical protein